ncbi:ribosomal RNA-processing protein 7 homolog A [Chiloscyllium plagiosum]|uniref:ribosomal RNA-processing protein 7 homolog A n=1 Tax=Chiloscyllium plagiosum TaxID=36176 RepID=UPI001CB7FAD3|nr:ribosomal RNA-processing protein 7 homolog A [Chiloscyllium plagiosum]
MRPVSAEMGAIKPGQIVNEVCVVLVCCHQECVHRLFSQCGPITSVALQEKPGPSSKSKTQESTFFSGPPAQGFQVAYVVFKSSAAAKRAVSLKTQEPWVLNTTQHPLRTGLQSEGCHCQAWSGRLVLIVLFWGSLFPDIAQLRRKFEEDKQKIALMRAQRKFKPY